MIKKLTTKQKAYDNQIERVFEAMAKFKVYKTHNYKMNLRFEQEKARKLDAENQEEYFNINKN